MSRLMSESWSEQIAIIVIGLRESSEYVSTAKRLSTSNRRTGIYYRALLRTRRKLGYILHVGRMSRDWLRTLYTHPPIVISSILAYTGVSIWYSIAIKAEPPPARAVGTSVFIDHTEMTSSGESLSCT